LDAASLPAVLVDAKGDNGISERFTACGIGFPYTVRLMGGSLRSSKLDALPADDVRFSRERIRRILMPRCENCGNDYDKSFEIRWAGAVRVFDSFECAIHALAPTCAHCGTRII
jgi:hypothetical protein